MSSLRFLHRNGLRHLGRRPTLAANPTPARAMDHRAIRPGRCRSRARGLHPEDRGGGRDVEELLGLLVYILR